MPLRLEHPRNDRRTGAPWLEAGQGVLTFREQLEQAMPASTVVMNGRMLPDGSGTIDHLVVSSTGVWLVDVHPSRSRIERTDVGTHRRPDHRLYIAGRDRTNMVRIMSRHTDVMQRIIQQPGLGPIPFHRVLCLTHATWGWFTRPFEIEEVLVTTPKRLVPSIRDHGPLDIDTIQIVATQLHHELQPV